MIALDVCVTGIGINCCITYRVDRGNSGDVMRIAITGIRGIPACYGGFETFAEELGVRLVALGHDVVVYGRKHVITHDGEVYRGVRLVLLPAPKHKYLETPVHTVLSLLHLYCTRPDVVLVCNAANSPFLWIARLLGIPVAVNVDGIERMRAKWNKLGKLWYRLGEYASTLFANRVIADAQVIRDYYRDSYRCESTVITYGYRSDPRSALKAGGSQLDQINFADAELELFRTLGVQQGRYLLYVSRLEPENNAHVVIQAYNGLPEHFRHETPLVIVGDAPYADDYIRGLKEMACPEVIFAGYRFGDFYVALQLGALLYIQATEVGGTHPALVESMGFSNLVVANDTPEHREVVSNVGLFFAKNSARSLQGILEECLLGAVDINAYRALAFQRAAQCYSWEAVTKQYEELFEELLPK